MFRLIKKIIKLAFLLVIIALVINFGVIGSTKKAVKRSVDEISNQADCILILGCGINDDDTPSLMLEDRLDKGIKLYQAGKAPKLLISGDNGRKGYNEIHVMLHYLLDKNIPAKDIFCDHAGFSTYDSIHRAGSIFGAKSIIIVTQKYHQYRSLFIAKKLGVDAEGCQATDKVYHGAAYREIREILARDKDFLKANLKLKPTYSGEKIPLTGDSKKSWEKSEL